MYGSIRTYRLHMGLSTRNEATLLMLQNSVGEVLRVTGVEIQTFVKPGNTNGTVNEHGFIVLRVETSPEEE